MANYGACMMLLRLLMAALGASLFSADDSAKYDMTRYVIGFFRKGPNYGAGNAADRQKHRVIATYI
jgi:hypothetical protein